MTTENMSDEYEAPELNEVGLLRKVTQETIFANGHDFFVFADVSHHGS